MIDFIPYVPIQTGSHTKIVVCPECKTQQVAQVTHTTAGNVYIHECDCGYMIMESEWYEVKFDNNRGER